MKRFPVALAVIVVVLALDQITKAWVASNLAVGQYWYPIPALGELFAITHIHNTGVVFGLFQGVGDLFAIAIAVITLVITRYLWTMRHESLLLRFALSLLLAGAVGNLIDRLRLGYVVDFVAVGSFARFNVADSAITIGVALLMIATLIDHRRSSGGRVSDTSGSSSV